MSNGGRVDGRDGDGDGGGEAGWEPIFCRFSYGIMVPIFRRFLYGMVLFFGMVLFLYQGST